MSQHRRPGDVAPLPSPTSRNGSSNYYFAPLGSTDEQSQQQQIQQQQAYLQAQREEYLRRMTQPHQQSQEREQEHQLAQQGQPYHMQDHAQHPQTQQMQFEGGALAQGSSAYASVQSYHHQQGVQYLGGVSGQHAPRQLSQSSTDSEASVHLRDFSLLAEAAKRAQVAVVTRDLEDISL